MRALAVALLAVVATPPAAAATDPHAHVRGMTVSCHGVGLEWGTDDMARTLGVLRDLGVNWVAIHPYGGIRDDGTVGRSRIDRIYDDPSWLGRAIEEAHAHGIKILIKPHLAYWGTRFSWRGDIDFDEPAEWARFFSSYEEWILRVARLSKEADAFAVGTELDRTVGHEAEWRRIVQGVRRETGAPLTYSASWDAYRDVPFWDALDVIGIQAYFPLVDHSGIPGPGEIESGWSRVIAELEEFSRERDRAIVFGELGYPRSRFAAVRPWSYEEQEDAEALGLQERCLEAALLAIDGSPAIVGAFLWKWFPGETTRGNFLKSTPEMRAVIAGHWRR